MAAGRHRRLGGIEDTESRSILRPADVQAPVPDPGPGPHPVPDPTHHPDHPRQPRAVQLRRSSATSGTDPSALAFRTLRVLRLVGLPRSAVAFSVATAGLSAAAAVVALVTSSAGLLRVGVLLALLAAVPAGVLASTSARVRDVARIDLRLAELTAAVARLDGARRSAGRVARERVREVGARRLKVVAVPDRLAPGDPPPEAPFDGRSPGTWRLPLVDDGLRLPATAWWRGGQPSAPLVLDLAALEDEVVVAPRG